MLVNSYSNRIRTIFETVLSRRRKDI